MNTAIFVPLTASCHAPFTSGSGPAFSAEKSSPLLNALWPSSDLVHQIATRDSRTGCFYNIQINGPTEAIQRAFALSDDGSDAYFACAGFLTLHSRHAANAAGASGFWIDVDCGEGKAADGKGYATVNEAEQALWAFCTKVRLPEPTHIVYTGGGLHAYWAFDGFLDNASWKLRASKLKFLTNAHGLLADDTRTADIASVLRVPGTLNFKYDPPRRVVLKHAAPALISKQVLLDSIERAHARIAPPSVPQPPSALGHNRISKTVDDGKTYSALDLSRLASALAALDPDCDENTWKLRRLAPLAGAARAFPEMHYALYELARSWSSGALRGTTAKAWVTPGGNGRTGEDIFDEVWARFQKPQNYAGKRTTLGTIYFDATAAGWIKPGDFTVVPFEVVRDETEEAV